MVGTAYEAENIVAVVSALPPELRPRGFVEEVVSITSLDDLEKLHARIPSRYRYVSTLAPWRQFTYSEEMAFEQYKAPKPTIVESVEQQKMFDGFVTHITIDQIADILHKRDARGLAYWLLSANSFLDGRRPADLIESDPARVIEAAKDETKGIQHG